MREHKISKEEFENKIKEIFKPKNEWSDLDIEIKWENDLLNECQITLKQMYEYVDVTFEHLLMLSEIAKTRKVNIRDKFARGGCSTCDYGSSYILKIYLDGVDLS